jgi:hypothetical protein
LLNTASICVKGVGCEEDGWVSRDRDGVVIVDARRVIR